MTVREVIAVLNRYQRDAEVFLAADEFATFHPVSGARRVSLVKGNMLFSHDGAEWTEDEDGLLCAHADTEVEITDRMAGIVIR